MPLYARRILFLVMSQIDSKSLIKEGRIFSVSAKNYSELCGVDIDTAYHQLKEGAFLLHGQSLQIPQKELLKAFARRPSEFIEQESKWRGMRLLHITNSCSYIDHEAVVQIELSRQIEPYICMLERDYTTQILLSSIRLPDTNASKLYQLLRRKISTGRSKYFESTVSELKKELLVDKVITYEKYKYFKNQFFIRSVKKILDVTEFTSISLDIIERKGKKASKVRISYTYEDN